MDDKLQDKVVVKAGKEGMMEKRGIFETDVILSKDPSSQVGEIGILSCMIEKVDFSSTFYQNLYVRHFYTNLRRTACKERFLV